MNSKNVVILGGTHQENDYNTEIDADDRNAIYNGCKILNPSIERAKIIEEKVGLRPGRSQVRLEQSVFHTSEKYSIFNIFMNNLRM